MQSNLRIRISPFLQLLPTEFNVKKWKNRQLTSWILTNYPRTRIQYLELEIKPVATTPSPLAILLQETPPWWRWSPPWASNLLSLLQSSCFPPLPTTRLYPSIQKPIIFPSSPPAPPLSPWAGLRWWLNHLRPPPNPLCCHCQHQSMPPRNPHCYHCPGSHPLPQLHPGQSQFETIELLWATKRKRQLSCYLPSKRKLALSVRKPNASSFVSLLLCHAPLKIR